MERNRIRTILLTLVLCAVAFALLALPRFIAQHQGSSLQAVISGQRTFPMTVSDVTGRKVTITKRPQRIISLSPSVTEILFAIGAGEHVVADTTYCDYPPAAKKLPKIGGYLDPNIEKITSLNPDLIIGQRGNRRDILDRLYALGLPIIAVDPTTIDQVSSAIQLVGDVTGYSTRAKSFNEQFSARKKAVVSRLSRISPNDRPKVLFLFSIDDGIFTVGPGSHIDELIRLAGGRNIAESTGKPWPQLSMEAVVKADPDAILLIDEHGGGSPLTQSTALVQLRANSHWQMVSAVKRGRVSVLDDDLITIPGPRLIDGLEQMAHALHPNLFQGKTE